MSGRAVIFYKCTRIKNDVSNVGCFAETTFGFINVDNVNVVRYLNNRECEMGNGKIKVIFG